MGKGRTARSRTASATRRTTRGSRAWVWVAAVVAVILLGASGLVWHLTRRFDPSVLVGRWQRPDGGYVIEISRVLSGGELEARYFNPRPIHVARAQVRHWERASGLFLELQDVGYPGSTYNLIYLARDDRLVGTYYQAALGETFEVFFIRLGEAGAR